MSDFLDARAIPEVPVAIHDGMRALERLLRRHSPLEAIDAAELRTVARSLCADAHRHHLRPEQLVVAVKSAWTSLPDTRAQRHTPANGQLLERVISLCISEYFDPPQQAPDVETPQR